MSGYTTKTVSIGEDTVRIQATPADPMVLPGTYDVQWTEEGFRFVDWRGRNVNKNAHDLKAALRAAYYAALNA